MPRVVVQIVTYNSAHTIDACLSALYQQDGDWIVQVIDNNSSDDTCERVRKWNTPFCVNPHNKGYAAAHNQGLQMTHTDYILTLNPDVTLQPDFIVNMCDALDAHPEVGMAAGCLLRVDSLNEAPYAVDATGVFLGKNRRQGLRGEGLPVPQVPQKPAFVFGVDGAAAFYRRAMLEDIAIDGEIFDEDFFMHKEDIDLCWRAQWRGWKAIYIPSAVAHHIRTFRPGKRDRVSPEVRRSAVKNRYTLLLKNDHPRLMLHDLLRISAYEVRIWIYLLLRERESLSSILEIWNERKRWLKKRAYVQSTRCVSLEAMQTWFLIKEYDLVEG